MAPLKSNDGFTTRFPPTALCSQIAHTLLASFLEISSMEIAVKPKELRPRDEFTANRERMWS